MVKVKKTEEQLQADNDALLEKVKTLEALKTPQAKDPGLDKYMAELTKIKKTARDDSNSIVVKEFADHKNISLWYTNGVDIGKRVGPMHQTNATKAFELFWSLGIRLSTDRPTPEMIEAYKLTDDYKQDLAKEEKRRAIKNKSRRAGQMDKMAEAIAKMAGTTVEAINKILPPQEVGKVKI
jgi:hypothetical protein